MGENICFSDAWNTLSRTFLLPGTTCNEADRLQAMCRTLIHDTFNGRTRIIASSVSQAVTWLQDSKSVQRIAKIPTHKVVDAAFSADQMINQLERSSNDSRSLFETTGHRFGSFCGHVRPGDKICLLYGGRLPFILREAGMVNLSTNDGRIAETQAYRLIGGECYVDGLVDGEGLKVVADRDPCVQDICLV